MSGATHTVEAGQETEADEIAARVGQRRDFGRHATVSASSHATFGTGRWPSSEFPFCALSVAMDLYDGGVDHGYLQKSRLNFWFGLVGQ